MYMYVYIFFVHLCISTRGICSHCKRKNARIEMRPCFCESKNVPFTWKYIASWWQNTVMHKNFDIHFYFLFYFKSSLTTIKPETMLSLALISSIILSVTKAFYRMFLLVKKCNKTFCTFYQQLYKTEQLFKQTGSFTLLLI